MYTSNILLQNHHSKKGGKIKTLGQSKKSQTWYDKNAVKSKKCKVWYTL